MKIDKNELRSKIQDLNGLTNEEKSALLELLSKQKKYGLVWEDKPEDVEKELQTKIPTLKEDKSKQILSNSEDAPNHVLIEGDNLHALTALQYTHAGKIDVIYIDPPYNTGSKTDFKYNDDYIDKENSWRHSLWANFIHKRLILAKTLLSDYGVIIVHIDENESAQLNLILDEVFTESNRLGHVVWNKRNPKGDPKEISTMHETIQIYAKNKNVFKTLENNLLRAKPNAQEMINKAKRLHSKIGKIQVPDEVKKMFKSMGFEKELQNKFRIKYDLNIINKEFQNWLSRKDFTSGEKAYKFIDETGELFQPVSMAWPNKKKAPEDYFKPLRHPITKENCPIPERGWRNPSKTMEKLLIKNEIIFGEDHQTQPRRKYLLKNNLMENTPSILEYAGSDDDLLSTLSVDFEYPKPVNVAKYFLNSVLKNANCVLDFFAGSGTTLHATMELNSEDNGNRKCILVTNNENNICEEVTYERNKRVIQGYKNKKGEHVEGLSQNSLRYFKTDYVDREPTLKNKKELVKASIDLLCIKEDCYRLNQGVSSSDLKVFEKSELIMIVCTTEEAIESSIDIIKGTSKPCKVYVFAPAAYPHTAEFEEELEPDEFQRIELCALPDAIYRAYQTVLAEADRKKLLTSTEEEEAENA